MTGFRREFSDDEIDRLLSAKLNDNDSLLEKMANPARMVYGVRMLSRLIR